MTKNTDAKNSITVGLIDNFDSFTFNIVHYLEALNCEVQVLRNDVVLSNDISKWDAVVISPGPGLPQEAGDLLVFIKQNFQRLPILGVCLGMQAIQVFFGGELYNLDHAYHGEQHDLQVLQPHALFNACPANFKVGLYHSWAVKKDASLCFDILAQLSDGTVQAFAHRNLPIYGVQFHPESIMTSHGKQIIANFVALVHQKNSKLV
ncbi:MAG: aminodeoxychorismate/anthranilate synthase component II [Crocinitomicaceae bacterium]|nr:aminodeoxychorismate/anthranilate synthase component II [Crocinitomicaceae bacterium]